MPGTSLATPLTERFQHIAIIYEQIGIFSRKRLTKQTERFFYASVGITASCLETKTLDSGNIFL
jgi:hypothetical protein